MCAHNHQKHMHLGPKRYLLFEDIWQVLCLFIIVGADRKTSVYNRNAKLEK